MPVCICDGVVTNRECAKNNGIKTVDNYKSYRHSRKCVIINVKPKYRLSDFFCNCNGIVANSVDTKNNVIKAQKKFKVTDRLWY